MTTTLYLVRHAEAEGNWRRTFQGHSNSDVSEKGYRQLEYLARRFADIPLDAVYASPLKRAYETAKAIDRAAGLPIVTDDGLMEINGGAFEGVPFAELPLRFPVEEARWDNEPWAFEAPGGESMRSVYERMRDTIGRIVRAHAGGTVAVASHGCAIRNYLCFAQGWPIERIGEVGWCDNTAVSRIEFGDDFLPRPVYLNDSSHLPEAASTFALQDWWRSVPVTEEDRAAHAARENADAGGQAAKGVKI